MRILQENDPEDRKVLETVCVPCTIAFIDDVADGKLEEVFRSVCRENGGIGLAANQLGFTQRFFYLDRPFLNGLAINPRIVSMTGVRSVSKEGCLSRSGMPSKKTLRYHSIRVRYRTIDGETQDEFLKGDDAVVFQHELDHLDGILI